MQPLFTIDAPLTADIITPNLQLQSITALEQGQVVYLPNTSFILSETEKFLLSPAIKEGKSKNISYCSKQKRSKHTALEGEQLAILNGFMQRYTDYSHNLITQLFPAYLSTLETGRTSYRPVEIKGRPSSYKKDDTRIHVDAFPATPVQGERILRVFCNVNPHQQPRFWNVGEKFSDVADRFLPRIKPYSSLKSKLLHTLKLTKQRRTAYDHYMLNIHDMMKGDVVYQNAVNKTAIEFPPYSTWLVYTDVVSHAALGGQYLLEQTYYLPPKGMADINKSPLKILESKLGRSLI